MPITFLASTSYSRRFFITLKVQKCNGIYPYLLGGTSHSPIIFWQQVRPFRTLCTNPVLCTNTNPYLPMIVISVLSLNLSHKFLRQCVLLWKMTIQRAQLIERFGQNLPTKHIGGLSQQMVNTLCCFIHLIVAQNFIAYWIF